MSAFPFGRTTASVLLSGPLSGRGLPPLHRVAAAAPLSFGGGWKNGLASLSSAYKCAVRTASGFSSAAFTDDKPEGEAAQQRRREEIQAQHQSHALESGVLEGGTEGGKWRSFEKHGKATFTYHPGEDEKRYAGLPHPTTETYQQMSTEELLTLLKTRESQAEKLRGVYERFHYEVDKYFRLTTLDYHDKAMKLSQVHGQMQHSSLRINREALSKLREEQEMMTRDKRLAMFLCIVVTFLFWIWVRRHYIRREELETAMAGSAASITAREQSGAAVGTSSTSATPRASPSITGAGYYGGGNWFGSEKRSARHRATAWEMEQLEKEKSQRQTPQEKSTPQEEAS